MQGVGWAPPITLITLAVLAALLELGAAGRPVVVAARGIGAYAAVVVGVALIARKERVGTLMKC